MKVQQTLRYMQNNPKDIFQASIFQYLKYHITILQRIVENEINQKEREQLIKVVKWINSKGIIYQLLNQRNLDERKIEIIETAIDILLSCVTKTPIQLSHNLLQFTQILFQLLYDKIINKYWMKQNIFKNILKQIEQKYQQQKGLEILINYQLCLMSDLYDFQQYETYPISTECIFQQDIYYGKNEVIFTLFQHAQKFLQDYKSQQYDIYYFFQQLKLTIISLVISQQQEIEITQIIIELSKGYQLCIQNNQNWRVHLGFLEMLLQLISYENTFIVDLQIAQANDNIIKLFNELSNQLMSLQIQNNINIWEHYIMTECNPTIKCYLAFSFISIKNIQNTQNIKSACQYYINLFFNSDQDVNTMSILKDENLQSIQNIFESLQEQQKQQNFYQQFVQTKLQKLQEEFLFKDKELNQLNIQLRVQNGNNINYLFKEVADCSAKEGEIFVVNDFFWKDDNNTEILLIEGMANSGKSNFLKRLQLFLFKHYKSNCNKRKWIPLFVQLALLKEPYNIIWNQIFVKNHELQQIQEFIQNLTDDLENEELNIVLLFDDLDEIKPQIKLTDLISNTIFQKKLGKNVKIIITSREEKITGLDFQFLTSLKILNLDEKQIKEYLQQYCVEVIRQDLQNICYYQIPLSKLQFNEYWEAFLLEEMRTLEQECKQNKYIWSDELNFNLQDIFQKIFDPNNLLQINFSQTFFKFLKMQSQHELINIIKHNQVIQLIQTPKQVQIILQILQNDQQVKVKKLNRKNRFKDALLKLTDEKIKSIYQLEQAKQFNQNEIIEDLMNKLNKTNFFDDYSLEKLKSQNSQISEDYLNVIKLATKQTAFFTYFQILKLFVYEEQQIYKLKNEGCQIINDRILSKLNKILMLLAANMITQQYLNLDQNQVEHILEYFLPSQDLMNYDEAYKHIQKSSFITVESNSYKFYNQSIQAYFVGKYILKFIKDFKKNPIELNLLQSQFNQNEFNLSYYQFNQVLDCIKSELSNLPNIKTILIRIIKQSRDERFIRAASNSILMINFLRFELIGEDLSGIKLSKTNVSGLNFFGSNLDESEFNEVTIDYCNFNNTSLQGVKWVQTPQNEVKELKVENSEEVCDMIFSPNSQYLISWSNSSVNIWNLQTLKLHKKLDYNLKLRSCVFSSDSTKLLLDFVCFQEIYRINNNFITQLIIIPQSMLLFTGFLECPFTFHNKKEKLLCQITNKLSLRGKNTNQKWYSFNLKKLIKSQQEWNNKRILDKNTEFTFIKQLSNGQVIIGTRDGQIRIWDNQKMRKISKNEHQSAIVSLSYALGEIKEQYDLHTKLIEQQQVQLLISASEEQVIIWLGYGKRSIKPQSTQDKFNLEHTPILISVIDEQVIVQFDTDMTYQKVKALPSQKINGQLPRYLNFNTQDLVYLRDKYLILYNLNKINELTDDIILKDASCIAINCINYKIYGISIEDYRLFIAKDDYIEIQEYHQNCNVYIPLQQLQNARIPLNNCQPLSMHFCSPSYLITYNKDRTIRFFYIDVMEENRTFIGYNEELFQKKYKENNIKNVQLFQNLSFDLMLLQLQTNLRPLGYFKKFNFNDYFNYKRKGSFKNSHLIEGFIKGDVQNLKQSCKLIGPDILKIAVQKNNIQINIYKVILSQNKIQFEKIKKVNCAIDSKIGCFALISDGKKICLGVDNIVQIRVLEPQDQFDNLVEIHTKDIYKILQNENEKYLVSCSYDNSIVIWNQDFHKIYEIKNQKCLDLVFESEDVFVLQTEKSIMWYKILEYSTSKIQNAKVQVIRYLDFEERGNNNILEQQLTIVKPLKFSYSNFPMSEQYLAVKSGKNVILKNYFEDDQNKVVIFNEQGKIIVFVNKNFIVYKMEATNTLQIMDIVDEKVIETLEFHAFTIRERQESVEISYILIAIETKNEIIVRKIQKYNSPVTDSIKIIQGDQTHLTLSDSGNFLGYTNNQEIAIYYITNQIKIIQLSKFIIDLKIKNIQISENYKIIIESENSLYQYELNVKEKLIYFDDSFGNTKYHYSRLNHNDEQLAIQSEQFIEVISLKDKKSLEKLLKYNEIVLEHNSEYELKNLQKWDKEQLKAQYFSISSDSKNFAISSNNEIKYYDWQKQIKCLYSFDYGYNLLQLIFLKDQNQIVAITNENLQIIQCKEKQIKQIKGIYSDETRISTNLDVVNIQHPFIFISNPEINNKFYNLEDYEYKAKNPQFTQDGEYILYEQNNNVIFQSLQNPNIKYIPENLKGQMNVSILSESNYLISFENKDCYIERLYYYSKNVDEYYINIWDASILGNIKRLFQLPVLQPQKIKLSDHQYFVSEIKNNILCVYDIRELQKDVYDQPLYYKINNVHLAGICPQETKFYSVSKDDYSISIWEMQTQELIDYFKGPDKYGIYSLKNEIIFVAFSEDEKYIISRHREKIIVWNMLSRENLQISDPFGFQSLNELHYQKTIYAQAQCNFVKLDNSLGITVQSQGELYIYDLKDFKSYELFYKISVNSHHPEKFAYKVFSNGFKVALKFQENAQLEYEIKILDVRKKEMIETIFLQKDELFLAHFNSESYFKKKKKKKEYQFVDYNNNRIHVRSNDTNLLQIYNYEEFGNEGAKPLYEIFINLNEDYDNPKIENSLIQLNHVGKKYLTYWYNNQLRVINLELYKKQVKLIKLNESEKFLPFYFKHHIIVEKSDGCRYFYNWKDCRKVNQQQEDEWNENEFVVTFSNDAKQLAQGWNDGDIIILEYKQTKNEYIQIKKWSNGNQALKNLEFTKDDKILISISQGNIISFWNLINNGELIQQIKIELNIISLVVSPNGFDIALELHGDQIQILTIDKFKCYYQNQQYIGCYKSYPKLKKLMTDNCNLKNSIIEDKNKNSMEHNFRKIKRQEFETQTIQDEQNLNIK